MATTLHSDLVIRDRLISEGFIEGIGQNVNAFNQASAGAVVFQTEFQEGEYVKRRFIDQIASSSISRRDLTSVAAATGVKLTMDEQIGVKLFRKAGPFDFTEGSLRTANIAADELAFDLGQQIARRMMQEALNSALSAVAAALSQETATLVHDATDGNIAWTDINSGLAKFGDGREMIAAMLMHSKPFADLVGDNLTNYKMDSLAGATVIRGEPRVGMGRAIVVTDSSGLVSADGITTGTDSYITLGLVPGAVTVTLSEALQTTQYYLDRDQVTRRIHPEYAYTLEVKGYKWDTTNGGKNPAAAAVTTASNWDAVVADKQDKAGVWIESQ